MKIPVIIHFYVNALQLQIDQVLHDMYKLQIYGYR